MIEYARCIYTAWANNKTSEYIQQNKHEFLALCSKLLSYTPEEINARLEQEHWYKNP